MAGGKQQGGRKTTKFRDFAGNLIENKILNLNAGIESLCLGGSGYFGLRSNGDVPTFRVDVLIHKYFRQGANLGFN